MDGSAAAFDGVLETPPSQLIDKRSARESLVSAAPFFSPPASHTPQSSLSAPLALFCRRSPPLCECAILAPRTRPFHLTGFTKRLGPKAARLRTGEFAAALLHPLDTLRPHLDSRSLSTSPTPLSVLHVQNALDPSPPSTLIPAHTLSPLPP